MLTLRVHQSPGDPRTWAFIDEVSLAPVYPELWVTNHVQPSVARPGAQVVYQITYGNRGSVAAPGAQVRDVLPAGVAYVGALPEPDQAGPTLVWEVGELAAGSGPSTIVVTATLPSAAAGGTTYTNTVEITSPLPERETSNNQAFAETWIGSRLYLPLAVKD